MLLSKIRKQTTVIMYIFLAAFAIGGVYGLFGRGSSGNDAGQPKKTTLPDEMAVVDGTPIPYKTFQFAYVQFRQRIESTYGRVPDSYDTRMLMEWQVLQQLINQQLLLREAKRIGAFVRNGDVANQYRMTRDQYVGVAQKPRGDDSSIQARIGNLMSDQKKNSDFSAMLAQMGMSPSEFKDFLRNSILENNVMKAIAASAQKTETDAATARAADVLKKLKAGEDFGLLASQYSEDPASKATKGDLGWISRGSLEPEVENAAFTVQPGQMSDLVKATSGVYIVQVLGQKLAVGADFETEKPAIVAELQKEKENPKATITDDEIRRKYEQAHIRIIKLAIKDEREIVNSWIMDARKKSQVKILAPEIEAWAYSMGYELRPNDRQPDPRHTLDLYKQAVDKDPNNEYLYYKIGSVYEQMAKEAIGKTPVAEDPYAKAQGPLAVGGKGATKKQKDAAKYMKEALENYISAYRMGTDANRYDANFYIAVARTSLALGKRKQAKQFYEDAADFSADDMQKLLEVKKGMEALGSSQKKIKEVDDMMAELAKAREEEATKPTP